jgi:carbon-monoxide dehydrogenase medium subunit
MAMTNLADTPIFCEEASQLLQDQGVTDSSIAAAVAACMAVIEPVDDNRGPVEFKKHAAAQITKRAIALAWSRT